MPSNRRVEPLDHFESDVRITAADSVAQWEIRNERRIPTREYLAWCSRLSREAGPERRDLHTEPFVLP